MNEKLSLRQKIAIASVKTLQKITMNHSQKQMQKIAQKHEQFIKEIQDKCADIVELEDEKQQPLIIAVVCTSIIQGFDTKKEMDFVTEMIKTAIEEYWKQDDISQKQTNTEEWKNNKNIPLW